MMEDLIEDQDQFFDTREEISDCSSDVGEKPDLDVIIGSNELVSSFGYDIWIRSPGTISERRHRLLKLIGLSTVADQREKEESASKLECSGVELDISRITEDYGAVRRSSSRDTNYSGQDLESCCSTDSSELLGEVLDDNLVYRIRNLDNGTEFIVDELGQDGLLKRLREVGSNRLVTGQEFERLLGMTPLVQQVMRKDAGLSPRSSGVTKRGTKGWLRWLRLSSAESANADGWSSHRIGRFRPQNVKVRTVRKRSKELSALCVRQDVSAHDGAILTMKFSPDGELLASAGEDGVVRVWQVTETQRSSHILDKNSSNIYFMTNDLGELVPLNVDKEKGRKFRGFGKSSESACVIFPKSGFCIAEKPLHEFHGHRAEVLDLSWSKDKCLLSSSADKTVRLWRVGSDTCQQVFSHNDYVTCVQFNPVDENHFISGSIDGKVRIWAVNRCEVVDWTDVKEIVTALSFQPDGKGAVVGSMSGDCFFFNTSDNQLQLIDQMCLQGKKKSPSRRITGLQFSPVDPERLMVTSADSQVRIFHGGNVICKYKGFRNGGSQICASFTPDGTHIVSASEDSNVYTWDHLAQEKRVKSTRSCERFFSSNACVAIPWNGTLSTRSSLTGPTAVIVKYMAEMETQQLLPAEKTCNRFPLFSPDSLSLGFPETPFSRGTATWPEEKLSSPSASASASLAKLNHKLMKTACQSLMTGSQHSWGSVLLTAGLDGKIRVFENYGLPVQV